MIVKLQHGPNDPAFPTAFSGHDAASVMRQTVYLGMTRREWMAAHAPAEAPSWFEGPQIPTMPALHIDITKRESIDDAKARHASEMKAWRAAVEAAGEERYFAWRYHWADQMLKRGAA